MTDVLSTDIQARHLLITQRLRQRRDALGLTQKQVVTRLGRCGLRTTNRALSSLEHGTGLDVAKLPELAAALDCTVTYLVGLTDDPHQWQPDRVVQVPDRNASSQVQPEPESTYATLPVMPDRQTAPMSLILGENIPQRR
ncbi:MAG: helix-turn-helix transcriptional regulator [Jatrophihabitantaceae bacterium]